MPQPERDPRKARTLGEASRKPGGRYDGARALSWLSEVLCPGRGVPVEEVRAEWERLKRERLRELERGR